MSLYKNAFPILEYDDEKDGVIQPNRKGKPLLPEILHSLFRETPDMIKYRREEGCQVVEMECATMAAIAQFRGIKFAQLLYSGDILFDLTNYNDREWFTNLNAREILFYLTLESAINCSQIE